MGTTVDKLNKVLETKEAIKQALINKGVQISDTDSFASYINKIEEIPSGGSSSSLPTPIGICGLSFWIDGQCNTRSGKDHSKKYMENLVWCKPPTTSTTNREIFPSASSNNVWNGDVLKYATYALYPVCAHSDLTVEMVFMLDNDYAGGYVNPYRQDSTSSGWLTICETVNDVLQFRTKAYGSASDKEITIPIELNKLYYCAITASGKSFKLFTNGQTQTVTLSASYSATSCNFAGVGVGSNGQDQSRWKSLNLGMVRMWSRVLSDEEIQANYADAKTRFGF